MQNIKEIHKRISDIRKQLDEIEESTTYYQVIFDKDKGYIEMEGKGNPKIHGELFDKKQGLEVIELIEEATLQSYKGKYDYKLIEVDLSKR
ncbi:MAG: hypothetical protein F4X82_02240 [Candidatus Spechtbacteria bacterium SB0662_bin_43]|uniref:Uncharacterized protein n=1 Tax=Candidatus Spechtbacteria bacterium SB0662_bin_43 TaxID=2604897 RepID=A0A845DJE9_9BACT|nr:hypothetical protein [Candidatus Spechtbacteria bacterium SB0662_bin_43]